MTIIIETARDQEVEKQLLGGTLVCRSTAVSSLDESVTVGNRSVLCPSLASVRSERIGSVYSGYVSTSAAERSV
jgi:hypothetical protein